MIETAIAKVEPNGQSHEVAAIMERVIIAGDLARLQPAERVEYYAQTCRTIGLNPLTRPFEYITLNGKLVLYARKDATDQLRSLKKVSITQLTTAQINDVHVCTATAQTADGRTDVSTGAVTIGNLKGDNLANALMKAETKAKRRVTLSICGLGMLDETELETIPSALPYRQPEPVAPAVAMIDAATIAYIQQATGEMEMLGMDKAGIAKVIKDAGFKVKKLDNYTDAEGKAILDTLRVNLNAVRPIEAEVAPVAHAQPTKDAKPAKRKSKEEQVAEDYDADHQDIDTDEIPF